MSGGSYNYLFIRDENELLSDTSDLEDMYERLCGLDYAQDAARETYELLLTIRAARLRAMVIARRMRDIWHAVEYWDSADWGEDMVKQALTEYRGITPTPDPVSPSPAAPSPG